MKRLYSTLRPQLDLSSASYADWVCKSQQKLSVSCRGLMAYTSSFCLNQRKPTNTAYHVYVADVNAPHQPYLLVDSEYQFTIIEWDHAGTRLLVCDATGSATVYTSKDYLISDWKPYFRQVFAAETFITAAWYHLGLVNCINVQNLKTATNHLEYTDKIQALKFGASLRLFGGKPAEGCILISRTGLVCCLTLMADGTIDVLLESIAPLRLRIEVADICHHKDGSFIVATSTGHINSTIAFYQLYLNAKNINLDELDHLPSGIEGRRVQIKCKQFNSFHLNIMAQILIERENLQPFDRVAHIKFVTKDSPDDILVEVSGQNLSLMELWELEPKVKGPINSAILEIFKNNQNKDSDTKPVPILIKQEENGGPGNATSSNKATSTLAASSVPNTTPNPSDTTTSKVWTFKGNSIIEKDLATIQTPRMKIFGSNRQLDVILLSYKDSTIRCVRKEDLQQIHEVLDLSNILPSHETSPYKLYQNRNNIGVLKHQSSGTELSSMVDKRTRPNHITDIQLSSNQTVFFAIDTMSQIHAIKLPHLIANQDNKDRETYIQYILEYSLVTGNDWWDAVVCVDQNSIENICDKFHDAYERQPEHLQRKYFNKQLMIRASLYRCLNNIPSLCKASDCHTMIMLNSIASTFKSLLRSQDHQDSPSENLTNFLKTQGTQPTFFNCNNVISKLNEREFYVENQLILSLQPLSQWVVNLAIFLMISLPQQIRRTGIQFPGAGLINSKKAIEIIRELLIIIKIWGNQNEASLPVIHKLSDQMDVLGILFRMISISYSTLSSGSEHEQTFLEECVQLANNISIPEFIFSLTPCGIASPLLYSRQNEASQSLVLEYFREPTGMPDMVTLPRVEGSIDMNGNRRIDVVRNISLGAYPVANLRQCTRCQSVSLIKPAFNTTRAWEQRWIGSCVCGGSWAQSDSNLVSKVGYLAWLHHSSTISSLSHSHQLLR